MIQRPPLVLLTNDDGVNSPGLVAAAQAVCDLGELLVVAPVAQQTGMGRGSPPFAEGVLSVHELRLGCDDVKVYAINGSPAQAVVYGTLGVAARRPDLVISGINYGENLGTAVTMSGTIGAALTGAELGVPSLAMSLEVDPAFYYNHSTEVDWTAAAYFTRLFARMLLTAQLPPDVDVLKVDVPATATPETPWRVVRQSRQSYWRNIPPSEPYLPGAIAGMDYELSIDWDALPADTDIYAFKHDRVVAVVPLSHDLTSRTDFDTLEGILRKERP